MSGGNVSAIMEYSYALPFEKNFDAPGTLETSPDLYKWAINISIIYLMVVYAGQAYMRNRPAFDLRPLLVLWNTSLAVMSVCGTLRILPEFYHVLKHFGFRFSLCTYSNLLNSPVVAYWYYVFGVSKFVELGDTAFVVLRKQKLTFLHWFHHSSVLVLAFFLVDSRVAMVRWFACMNYVVHSFMYSYFALRAMKVKVPRRISIFVTSLQILQMLAGFFISILGYKLWYQQEQECAVTGFGAKAAVTVYSIYFALFIHFFLRAYTDAEFLGKHMKKL